MKKIISTLTAMTFALGLAAAAQAQIAKTPEKPEVKSTQAQTQVTPQEAAKTGEPAAKEAVKTGDKTKEMVKPGDQDKGKHAAKKEAKKLTKQGGAEKKAGAPMATTPAAK
ncbi:MAG: hypothetical protein M0P73_04555 [Syntrophobacterales bacterium]|jgi:hypothetical protein|nr:hypothetical protein [Syntrophobacterales bacterium]